MLSQLLDEWVDGRVERAHGNGQVLGSELKQTRQSCCW
jgi:hypothetical protein